MPTILVVDDEPKIREALSRLLKHEGHVVHVAETGQSAIGKFLQDDFDLTLLDIALPDMNGLDVFGRLREKDGSAVCVFITAFGTVQSAVEAMRLGAVDFLEKPFDRPALLQALCVAMQWASKGRVDARADAAAAAAQVSHLTPRELTIFNEFAVGASTKQVARTLTLSPKTVETYRTRLLSKLDVDTPYALVRLAVLNLLFGNQEPTERM